MATEKRLNTRITQKHDTEFNWKKAANFAPLKGEIIIYDIDLTHPELPNNDKIRIKIGDGKTLINDLTFYNPEQQPITGSYDEVTGYLTLSLMFGGYNEDTNTLILGYT